jgi:catechol 2,3-dioxygenase-like lactoylglutathione lyase family enzyme
MAAMKITSVFFGVLLFASSAFAQLVQPNQVGVRMGHIHLAVKDVDAQKKFWLETMGGTLVTNGRLELIQFPGVFIMLRQSNDAPPPAGSIVDHFGFAVKDMKGALAKWKAANVEIEPTENPNEVYVHGPDGIRVAVDGEPALPTAIAMHSIYMSPIDVAAMKQWYVTAFGDIPGVTLTFSQGTKMPVGTKGRAIDHIGFDVDNLEAFAATLNAKGIKTDGPVRTVNGTTVKNAYLTDPWGTYIELTEGLAPK